MFGQVRRLATVLIFGACALGTAQAQSTWNYASFTENGTNAGNYGNSYSATIVTTKLTVSAYSSTTGSAFATANLANYGVGSGFGVRNQTEGLAVTSPQHSMDNYSNTDMLALSFTNSTTSAAVKVVLTDLATGWHNAATVNTCGGSTCGKDSDISLLRWEGSGTPTIVGGTIASLLTAGWKLVNNYADMVDDVSRATGLNTSSTASSWWLISAYNSAWGTGTNTTNLSNADDFVKVLSSVSAVPAATGVPEPGSLALVTLAMLGLGVARRAKRG